MRQSEPPDFPEPTYELELWDDAASHQSKEPAFTIRSSAPFPRLEVGDRICPYGWWIYADVGNIHRVYKTEYGFRFKEGKPTIILTVWTKHDPTDNQ